MKYTHQTTPRGPVFLFENGVTLESNAATSTGAVTYPATSETGPFTFPIRHSGDCFHALKQGLPIPAQCKAW